MRAYIGGHQAVDDLDFAELALGTPPELWLGVEGETDEERAAREDAARDILADNPEMTDDLIRLAAEVVEANTELFGLILLPRPVARRRTGRKGAAA